jgi:hypothetical protein
MGETVRYRKDDTWSELQSCDSAWQCMRNGLLGLLGVGIASCLPGGRCQGDQEPFLRPAVVIRHSASAGWELPEGRPAGQLSLC